MNIHHFNYIALSLAMLFTTACRDYDDDGGTDKTPRVSLYPAPEVFAADGRTESGDDSYVAVVTLNNGGAKSNQTWTAEIADATWASVSTTTISSDFQNTWTNAITTVSEQGIELKVEANTEYRRHFTLNIRTADGVVTPFEFTQLGEKADATVTLSIPQIEFASAGESQTFSFDSNMGDVYDISVAYDEQSSDWLTWQVDANVVTLTSAKWDSKVSSRTAVLTVTVGTDDTSKASASLTITQLAEDDYYYIYGASCDNLSIENSLQLTKSDLNIYSGTAYFKATADKKNPILINKNSRTLNYPYYCLTADGKVAEVASASATVPAGPDIDVDGRRTFVVNFGDMTWTWNRITVTNCMPDEELAKYKTKGYIARDGSMKTWMVEFVRWDGGDIKPKLGSPMVATATGTGAAGTGGYGTAAFPTSWSDTGLNMAYETTEMGGQLEGTSENGRIYAFNEIITGEPRYGLGYARYEELPESLHVGSTFVDAVGNTIEVEGISVKSFTGDNDADEKAHSSLTMQIQGICPYGWHIANAADWLDLAWAACKASNGHTYPMQEDQITYKQLATTSGTATANNPVSPRGIGNFAAWLRNSQWVGSTAISDGADEFGFNYYPLGFRYMTQGYQCAGTRVQTWIPLVYDYSAHPNCGTFRINVIINNTVSYAEMANFDNGQGVVPFRCVKNYK
jgi:uncharacterized protein (TIGR02145 family)